MEVLKYYEMFAYIVYCPIFTFRLAGFMIIDINNICPFNATVIIGLTLEDFDVKEYFSCTTVLCVLITVQ